MDKFLLFFGVIATICTSVVQPLNTLFFGDLTQSIIEYAQKVNDPDQMVTDKDTDDFLGDIRLFAIEMGGLGLAMLILGYISMQAFSYTALKQVRWQFIKLLIQSVQIIIESHSDFIC